MRRAPADLLEPEGSGWLKRRNRRSWGVVRDGEEGNTSSRAVVEMGRADAPLLTLETDRESRKSGRKALKPVLIAADAVMVLAAMALAYRLRSLLPGQDPAEVHTRHLAVGLLSLPLWGAILARYRLYRGNSVVARRDEWRRLVHAVAASVAAMALVGFMGKLYVARSWILLTFLLALLLLAAEREVMRRIFRSLRRQGRLLRRVLIVGANADAVTLGAALMADPALGYDVVGFVDDNAVEGFLLDHRRVMGSVNHTLQAVRTSGAEGVIVVTTAVGMAAANRLARELPEAGIRVEVMSALRDIAVERLDLRSLGQFPMLHVEPVQRRGWRVAAKRGFDATMAAAALVLTAPLLAVVAVAIKITSPGPVLFRQQRLGRGGELFPLLKFRTMVVDAEQRLAELRASNEADGPLFKLHRDPRVTPLGRFLRRFSIDELPQLWNVLRGDMALVGPRPALPTEVSGWSPELHQRLRVRPGITGMWQVNGRSRASFDDYCRLDLYYVDNWSLLTDLSILVQTVPAVLLRRGAY